MQPVSPQQTKAWAQAHLDGVASDEHVSFLEQNTEAWVVALRELRGDVQATIDRVAEQVTGPERGLVLDDFAAELQRVERMLTELTGEELSQPERDDRREIDDDTDDVPLVSGVAQLQLSWHRDRIVAWAAGHRATPEPADQVLERLSGILGGFRQILRGLLGFLLGADRLLGCLGDVLGGLQLGVLAVGLGDRHAGAGMPTQHVDARAEPDLLCVARSQIDLPGHSHIADGCADRLYRGP